MEALCDCHIHFYDHRCSLTDGNPFDDRGPADYEPTRQRLGVRRVVVVQPSYHGNDNRPTVNAISRIGPSARGVAVIDPLLDLHALRALKAAGIAGIRLYTRAQSPSAHALAEEIQELAEIASRVGWHLDINLPPQALLAAASSLRDLPVQLVFDHLAKVPQPTGKRSKEFRLIKELLVAGKAWVKVSGPYLSSQRGAPGFDDVGDTVRELAAAAPDRMVWGSDWPHPTIASPPDDEHSFNLVSSWLPNDKVRAMVFSDNAARLYGFHDGETDAGGVRGWAHG
ncbi:MAG TPA: amidohydrolase family protein [Flexivirga sp.]|uniref:amidohydrolase family protein n=1 Tax=Flexivirga sp. TaxID=1962927 RepID=UPI002B78980F|nr:amidohydrolase family protein [Flexivirga sp.]HWC22313.1 amidohydrolase family protein [Flexivirga sp.]